MAELPHEIQAADVLVVRLTGHRPEWTIRGRVYSMKLTKDSKVLSYTLYLPVNGLKREFFSLTVDGEEIDVRNVAEALREFSGKNSRTRLPKSASQKPPRQLRMGVIMRN